MKTTNESETKQNTKKKMYEVMSEPYVYIYMHNLLFWGLSKL